jgi:DNA polymerase I-like protein with 3'-5' exonuclease and polymerase domains
MALRMVREAKEIAYDVEASGIDWKVNNPIGYVVTTDDANVYVPVRHAGGGNLLDGDCPPLLSPTDPIRIHAFERDLAAAFDERRRRGGLTIGHNILFDMHMSANAGIMIGRNVEDTSINAALLDEHAKSYSLENCAKREKVTAKLGQEMYDHLAKLFGVPNVRDSMSEFWRTDGQDPVVQEYAMGDGATTLELRRAQRIWIDKEDPDEGLPAHVRSMAYIAHVEHQLIWTVFRVERRGMKVDEKRIAAVEAEIATRLDAATKRLPHNFNTRSGPQVKNLMESAGHTDWPTTALGNPSFTEKWLKTIPLGRDVIDVRKLTNLGNTFIGPLKDRHIHKGRVHAQLNQMKGDEYGTISGRFSCSNPNMQQVPKRDKDLGRLFRSIFVPDAGMEFYEADYSQNEPRLFAHYSKEPALIEGYNSQPFRDVHQVVAEQFGVDRDVTAKRMNMGIFTGMQPKTFAIHMGWDLERATNEFNAWFRMFPAIDDFQKRAKNAYRDRGFIRTILGRQCRLEHARFAYQGTSRIIQGGAADMLKERMLCADQYLESENDKYAHILMTIHDSFPFQAVKGAKGEAAAKELIRIWEDVRGAPYNMRVPFVMDVGKGPDWGIATYGPIKIKEAA